MSCPGVTIAIPNWNHEVFLPRSIRSGLKALQELAKQGVPGEVLVIDDCSRDGSVRLLRQLEARYYDQGLRVLAMSENKGLAGARNTALHAAQHQYVAFMDADNEILPQSFPLFYQSLFETRAAVVFGNLLVRNYGENRASGVLSNQSFRKKMFETQSNYIDAFALVDRVQILDEGGYDGNYHSHHDYELWQHLAANGRKLVFIPAVFGYYYVLPGSMIKDSTGCEKDCSRLNRVFNQIGIRQNLPLETRWLQYHPHLGWL